MRVTASVRPATRSSRRPSRRWAIQVAIGADSATPRSIAVLHAPAAASPCRRVTSSTTTVHAMERQNESTRPAAMSACSLRRLRSTLQRVELPTGLTPRSASAGGGNPLKCEA